VSRSEMAKVRSQSKESSGKEGDRPFVMGTEMLEPIKLALVWDAESSGPSSVCFQGSDSGMTLSNALHIKVHQHPIPRTISQQNDLHIHIFPDVAVVVLVDRQSSRRMLYEEVRDSDLSVGRAKDQSDGIGERFDREKLTLHPCNPSRICFWTSSVTA